MTVNGLPTSPNKGLSAGERRTTLTKEFGSRKKKRSLVIAEDNIIDTENLEGAEEMQNILHTKSPNKSLLDSAAKSIKKKLSGSKRKQ